jgi:hypothetical protein
MPCRDGRDNMHPAEIKLINETSILHIQHRKEIDALTEMLCSVCRVLEASGYCFQNNPQLDRWWANHKAEDEKKELMRQHKESVRAGKALRHKHAIEISDTKSISTLTAEERKLLKEFRII